MYTEALGQLRVDWNACINNSPVPYLECLSSMIPVPVSVAMGPSRAGIGGCELPSLLSETSNSQRSGRCLKPC
jgi:hypothetical protein